MAWCTMRLLSLLLVLLAVGVLGSDCPGVDRLAVQITWFSQPQTAGWEVPNNGVTGAPSYKDECLRVQVRPGGPDFDPLEELLEERADVALAEGIHVARHVKENPGSLTIIANYFQRNPMHLISLQKGMTLQDLAGKNVGVWGWGNDIPIKMLFKKENVSVNFVDQSFTLNQLYDGTIDAASVMTYNEMAMAFQSIDDGTNFLRQFQDISDFNPLDFGVPLIHNTVVVKTERVADLAGQLVRLLRVVNRAWLFCRDNQVACAMSYPSATAHFVWQMREISKLIFPSPEGLGVMVPEMWDEMDDYAAKDGRYGADASKVGTELINNSFILEALQDPKLDNEKVDDAYEPGYVQFCAPYGSASFEVCDDTSFQHTLCPVGHFPAGPVDGDCSECSPGRMAYETGAQITSSGTDRPCSPRCEARMLACVDCPKGFYQDSPGQHECYLCPSGRFRNDSMPSISCDFCPLGRAATESGMTTCNECPLGQFKSDTSTKECERCPRGRYASEPGSAACTACPAGMISQGLGTYYEEECKCPAGQYAALSGGCRPCPGGMTCSLGSSEADLHAALSGQAAGSGEQDLTYPELAPRHFSSEEAPLDVYLCKSDRGCPGGKPGTCGGGQHNGGFLCLQCADGMFLNNDLQCADCDWHHLLLPISFGIASFVGLLVLARVSVVKLTGQRPHLIVMLIVLGQVVTLVQVVAAFYATGLDWGAPFNALLKMFSFVIFDFEFFKSKCMNLTGGASLYFFQMISPLICVAIMISVFGISRFTNWFSLESNGLINSIGQFAQMLYISLTLLALVPFHCYPHPNGEESIVQFPEVFCWKDDHTSMLIVGIAGILVYPVLTVCVVFYAVWKYPRVIVSPDISFLWRFRFVFYRWSSDGYWFGSVMIVRNFLIAVFPMTISPEHVDATVMLMQVTLITVMLLTALYLPWKTPATNTLDLVLNFVLVFVMCVGSMTVHGNELSDGMSTVLVVLVISVVVMAVFLAMQRSLLFFMRRPRYMIFLSHHKGAGACVARLLKYVLQRDLGARIFYDCDDLRSLASIFDAVKQSQNLLAILSGETLCRPWCVGEIVTAHHCAIQMYGVQLLPENGRGGYDKFFELSDAERDRMFSQYLQILRPFGITPEDVPPAFEALLARKPLQLDMGGTSEGIQSTIKEIQSQFLLAQNLLEPILMPQTLIRALCTTPVSMKPLSGNPGSVLLMSEPGNPEAVAAAHLLRLMLQEALQEDFPNDLDMNSEQLGKAVATKHLRVIVWLVTPSTLDSAEQLSRLATVFKHRPQAKVLPTIIGDSFDFPGEPYFARLEEGSPQNPAGLKDMLASHDLQLADAASAVRRAFKEISTFVNVPRAEQAVLTASVQNLAARVTVGWSKDVEAQFVPRAQD